MTLGQPQQDLMQAMCRNRRWERVIAQGREGAVVRRTKGLRQTMMELDTWAGVRLNGRIEQLSSTRMSVVWSTITRREVVSLR